MPKKHYKLSCVGIDNRGNPSRMIFFVYDVEGVENARRIVRKDKKRRQMMRNHNVEWRTIPLNAVECTRLGKVEEQHLSGEMEIISIEAKELLKLQKEYEKEQKKEFWAQFEEDGNENAEQDS